MSSTIEELIKQGGEYYQDKEYREALKKFEFLTIESALFAFSLHKENVNHAGFLTIAGFLLTLIWYRFSATDNFLVEVYRRQVAHVFNLMESERRILFHNAELDEISKGYLSVGSTGEDGFNPDTLKIEPIKSNFWQSRYVWKYRSVHISATELGVVFSVLFFLLWISRFFLLYVYMKQNRGGHFMWGFNSLKDILEILLVPGLLAWFAYYWPKRQMERQAEFQRDRFENLIKRELEEIDPCPEEMKKKEACNWTDYLTKDYLHAQLLSDPSQNRDFILSLEPTLVYQVSQL
ncbi:MAG: hypothetical protein MRJ65_14660 [Candidatus Brocadiaceae bacterium]|nr:hypothetical protein [Candidatus Brocadiaceae bacterium]